MIEVPDFVWWVMLVALSLIAVVGDWMERHGEVYGVVVCLIAFVAMAIAFIALACAAHNDLSLYRDVYSPEFGEHVRRTMDMVG